MKSQTTDESSLFIMNLNCLLFNICKEWMWFICASCIFWNNGFVSFEKSWELKITVSAMSTHLLHIYIKNVYVYF